ncbi:MAG: CHASE3 domain-containing protein [Rhodospirillaceae bacterium]
MTTTTRALPARPAVSRPKVIAFAVLATLLLAGLVLFGYITISQMLSALDETDHGIRVREQLRVVRNAIGDMEGGQRGYLITGQKRYLEPFNRAGGRIDAGFAELGRLTREDAAQQRALVRLRDVVSAKRVELKNTLDVFDARGFDDARTLMLSDTGKRLMDEIRALIEEIDADEARRLAAHREEASSMLRRTIALALLFCGLLAALLGIIHYLLGREIAVHAHHRKALAATSAEPGSHTDQRTRSPEDPPPGAAASDVSDAGSAKAP